MTSGVDAPLPTTLPDSDHGRPTLKTIAAETGLAVATVSRALKDAPDIGEATKRRVREAAARLGYRPNRAGVRLRTGKTNVIALVLSTESDGMTHTSQLIYSIANALRGTAYHLIVTPYFPDQDPMDPIRYLVETESADAIILNQTKPDDPRVRYMAERHFPFATHGRTTMDIDHSYYDFDNEAFATIAVQALAAAGRKQLLLVPPPRTQNYARHMITGFLRTAGEQGVSFEVLTTASSDSGSKVIEAAVREHLAHSAVRPDGLVCGSTTAAMSAVNAAESLGLVLGRDFDLVAKEALQFLHRFRREIMVVHEDVREAGGFLARAVVAAVECRDTPAKQGLERPVRVDRASDDKGGSR